MQLNEVSQKEFESMFGEATPESAEVESPFSFKATESLFTNLKDEILNPKKVEETKTNEDEKVDEKVENTDEKASDDDSLFKADEAATPTEDKFDIKSYFSSRIKEGKFLPLEDEKLETAEDYDALIEANFEHKIATISEDLNKNWYDSKSNAWKFIAKHSEAFSSPKELIPLLQGIQNIETVANLNPKELSDAEQIVRISLSRRGEPSELIETQITAFKDNNTLSSMAETYQPLLIKEENAKIAQETYRKEQESFAELQQLQEIHAKTVEVLEKPFLGKHKLKRDEKSVLYDLLAEPEDVEGGGYKIFTEIDNLYAKGDYETLLEIGLILAKKDAHRTYLGITTGDRVAEGLMRKVKASVSSNTGFAPEEPAAPATPKLKAPSRSSDSGFSFFKK